MGRLTQGHFDDVFLNKVKQACLHVLDQLNEANEIDQAFDLCPSISRRNRVILSFLRDADNVRSSNTVSSSTSPPLLSALPYGSIRPSREPSLGTDSVASLSAQRRRRAREMQYVRDPIDSNDESDSQATVGPSSSSRAHLDPASARNPSMSQPDYTFEQFAEHLDPSDKLLKRSLEIVIKETARQALARKRDPNSDSAAAPSTSRDPATTLRSTIASSHADRPGSISRLRDETGFARRMSRVLNLDSASASRGADSTANDLDHTYQLLRSLRPAGHSLNGFSSANPSSSARRSTWTEFLARTDTARNPSTSSLFANRAPTTSSTTLPIRHGRPESSNISPDSLIPQLSQRRSIPRPPASVAITPETISARLAEASRRNAEAAITIGEAERLRSSQFIRTSIESLRASLFQLHMDLACTQLQQAQTDRTPEQSQRATSSDNTHIGASYALVMDTIELFDDTLRRLSCLVSNTSRDDYDRTAPTAQGASANRNADSSRMRTSLWRARNLLLLSSMTRRPNQPNDAQLGTTSSANAADAEAELRAHRHLLATIEESHWSRADAQAPCADSIRAWRRKLAAWYHLDRDSNQYPDAPQLNTDREEPYARWHPDAELPYALDDEIMAPMTNDTASARPHPIAHPRAAWDYARRHDNLLASDLNDDQEVRQALNSTSVASALQQLLRLRRSQTAPSTGAASTSSVHDTAEYTVDQTTTDADPDVSLTRTTSLSRRNAVRGMPLSNSDSSSIRSARSSLSLRRPLDRSARSTNLEQVHTAAEEDNDAVEEDVVETSIEIGTAPRIAEPSNEGPTISDATLRPPSERPRAGRSGSFTFVTTPAAVLRSRQRSESRSQAAPSTNLIDEDIEEEALEERDSEAEEYIDLDLDLGMAGEGAFDFDLSDFLRSESRRFARRQNDADDEPEGADSSPPALRRRRRLRDEDDDSEPSDTASPTGIRVFVSGSGASTPAEARQATFEAYAQRARLLERRRRMERQRQESESEAAAAESGGGNGSAETSPESRRRRRGRHIGVDSNADGESGQDRRNSLPFPRTSER